MQGCARGREHRAVRLGEDVQKRLAFQLVLEHKRGDRSVGSGEGM